MRVFYMDEDDITLVNERTYYVKLENVNVPDELKGFKAINAVSIQQLINKIIEYYGLDRNPDITVQLWSNSTYTGHRLDILKEIPVENDFIWARLVLNKNQ